MSGYGPVSPDDVDYDEDGPDPNAQLDAQREADAQRDADYPAWSGRWSDGDPIDPAELAAQCEADNLPEDEDPQL